MIAFWGKLPVILIDGEKAPCDGIWVNTKRFGPQWVIDIAARGCGKISTQVEFYGRNNKSRTGLLLGTAIFVGEDLIEESAQCSVAYREMRACVREISGNAVVFASVRCTDAP